MNPVTVLDARNETVSGLDAADFVLTDNGAPQRFHLDTSDTLNTPIALAVVVQTTESSAAALARIRKTGAMIQPLVTGDRGQTAVFSYDDDVRLEQELSSDPGLLTKTFRGLKAHPAARGRMLDAVQAAMGILAARAGERKVVLVIGESKDRGSNSSLEVLLDGIARDGVMVYAITYSAFSTAMTAKPSDLPPPSSASGILGALSELGRLAKSNTSDLLSTASGGERFTFTSQRALEQCIGRFGEHLHSQYMLSFSPPKSTAPGIHVLRVALAGHPGYRIKSRQAYDWSGQ